MRTDTSRTGTTRRRLLAAALASPLAAPLVARAQPRGPVRVAVLNDQSGHLADLAGLGSVEAARMAIEEFGAPLLGAPVELLSADHQNRADVGAAIVTRWFDTQGVGAAFDFGHSAISLAAQQIGRQRDRIVVHCTSATADLTGPACSPVGFHWVYDTFSNGAGTARALVGEGLDSWFFIAADYAFGRSLEAEASRVITAAGGRVLGTVRHQAGTTDFSSLLLQAQQSRARVVCFANVGGDLINCIKQASEFGMNRRGGRRQALVAPVMLLTDVHALGLETAQGLRFITSFYWDMDEETRAWSRRFFARRNAMPTMAQAGTYSAVLHYLKAVQQAGTTAGSAVAEAMHAIPVRDMFARNAALRRDGRLLKDMYTVEVKAPAESRGAWDYYRLTATVPGERAFRPLNEGGCPLVRT
jgi:branched-chain amino acid transport system substrate-binding protein